jgi:hypothetical protein
MTPIGAYLIVKSRETDQTPESRYPVNDPVGGGAPRPGLRERVRRALRPRPRVAREPGFAATHSMLSDVVPQLRAYPYPPTYR